MTTGNERYYDRTVSYALYLERQKNGAARRLRDFVLDLDKDIADNIQRRLEALSPAERARLASGGNATTARLQALRDYINEIGRSAGAVLSGKIVDEVAPLGEIRAQRLVNDARVAVGATLAMPSLQRIEASLRANPFEGKILKEWASEWSASRRSRMLQAIRVGMAQGESTDNIVKRIRGTRSQGYKDGILEVSRRGAQMIARTASNHIVSVADIEVAQRNSGKIEGMQRTAVLDSRTSEDCRVNDGRIYSIDETAGVLPAHPNCRSFWQPILKGEGRVPKDENFSKWIERQPASVQDEALGATKGKLLREGGLDYKDLVKSATAGEYTVAELREKYEAAFDKAFGE